MFSRKGALELELTWKYINSERALSLIVRTVLCLVIDQVLAQRQDNSRLVTFLDGDNSDVVCKLGLNPRHTSGALTGSNSHYEGFRTFSHTRGFIVGNVKEETTLCGVVRWSGGPSAESDSCFAWTDFSFESLGPCGFRCDLAPPVNVCLRLRNDNVRLALIGSKVYFHVIRTLYPGRFEACE